MKKLRLKTILTLLFLGLMLLPKAQTAEGKTKGKILNPGPKMPRIIFSAGYGNTMPSSTAKDAYFTNSSGISGDLFVPFLLFRKGWDGTVKGGNYGFNLSGSYNFTGNGNPSVPLPNAFAITGQTASSVVYKGVDPRNPGFRIGGGPQANFYLMNRLILSPMVLAEYFSVTQKELSAVQTTQINGQTKEYNLLTLPETKTSGFSITPKVRMSYFLAENFGIFADAGYIFGPKVNTQTTSLKPQGNPNQAGQYNQQQLDSGTQIKSEVKSTSYQAFAVNVGLSLAFGGKKGWNGMTKTDDKGWNGVAKSNDKGWNGITKTSDKGWNGKQEQATRKGWDGTVKGLFDIKTETVSVPKNGGIEKLVDHINKSGKGKASVYKRTDKEFIQIEAKNVKSFYEIDNSNPAGIIIQPGGVTCKVALCPNGSPCTLMNLAGRERCACNDGTPSTANGCGVDGLSVPITDFISAANLSAIDIETDNTGTTLSPNSVKNFYNYIKSVLPDSEMGKTEIFTEANEKYMVTPVKWNGDNSAIYSKLSSVEGTKYNIVSNILMSCYGTCPDNGSQCSGYVAFGHYYKCSCSAKCGFKIIRLPSGSDDPVYNGPISADNIWKE